MTNNTKFPNQKRGPRQNPNEVQIGQAFGYWTVTGPYTRYGQYNQAHFPCICQCGTERDVVFRRLQEAAKGKAGIACGCYQKEVMATKRKYGEPGTPEHQKSRWLWTAYKMTLVEYNSLLEEQNGQCKICECVPNYDLYVDHNHQTGVVRGLLCQDCNFGLANFKDNITIMKNAIKYTQADLSASPAEVMD